MKQYPLLDKIDSPEDRNFQDEYNKKINELDKESGVVNVSDKVRVLTGVQVEEDGESKVNIKFWPIFLFVGLIITGVLFTIYKIVELIINSI